MKRKVVKHGSATLTVSLPSKWAKKYGIRAGDEIDIKEDMGKLVITTDKGYETIKECNLDLDLCGPISQSCIGALYKGGADSIRLKFTKQEGMQAIDNSLKDLLGFEIMQQSNHSCIIKEISTFGQEDLNSMLKRTFLLLISISDDSLDSLKQGNKELLKKIIERDIIVNKFANYCRRIMNKKGILNIKNMPMTYYIVEEVENLGDEYKYLCKYILENNIKIDNREIFKIFESLNQLFSDFFHLYFKFSIDKARKLAENKKKLTKQINKLFKTAEANDARILDCLHRMAVIVTNMVGPLLTMKMAPLCDIQKTME
jgi:phosphate uptake regulator